MLIEAGAGDRPLVFLFSDTQIAKEGFVEDINNMLNAGEVRPRRPVRCLRLVSRNDGRGWSLDLTEMLRAGLRQRRRRPARS